MNDNQLGNPLDIHPNLFTEVKNYFETKARYGVHDYPIKYEIKPSFKCYTLYLCADDYRITYFINMPHLLRTNLNNGDDFIRSMIKSLLLAMKEARKFEENDNSNPNSFISNIHSIFFGQRLIQNIAEYVGVEPEYLFGGLILFMKTLFKKYAIGRILSYISVAQLIQFVIEASGFIQQMMKENEKKLIKERINNYSELLNKFFIFFTDLKMKFLESNLIVCSIDQRNFATWMITTKYRRNDGVFCDCFNFEDLKCSPLAKNIEGNDMLKKYIEIISYIKEGGIYNFDNMMNYIYGNPLTRQISGLFNFNLENDRNIHQLGNIIRSFFQIFQREESH